MLENAAPFAHGSERGFKAPAVVAGPVVLAAVSLVVERGEVDPEMTRRMRNDRQRSGVEAGVAGFGPCVNAGQSSVTSVRLNK